MMNTNFLSLKNAIIKRKNTLLKISLLFVDEMYGKIIIDVSNQIYTYFEK